MSIKNLKPIGKCIYCGAYDEPLSKEHIIPYGLAGDVVLPKASCAKCAAIISRFEGEVLRKSLFMPRIAAGLPTRHPQNRPKELPLTITLDNQELDIDFPVEDQPAIMIFLEYKLPAYLDGREYEDGKMTILGITGHRTGNFTVQKFASKYGIDKVSTIVEYSAGAFPRLLAKIAYGHAVAEYGVDAIEEPYVLPMILGTKKDYQRWVGCTDERRLGKDGLHLVQIGVIKSEIRAHIKLFALSNTPEYLVIVGRLSDKAHNSPNNFKK